MQLADHVALITGSARGIGRATARRLAQQGANIVIADINAAGAEEAAAEIEDLGRQAIAVHADVTHPKTLSLTRIRMEYSPCDLAEVCPLDIGVIIPRPGDSIPTAGAHASF